MSNSASLSAIFSLLSSCLPSSEVTFASRAERFTLTTSRSRGRAGGLPRQHALAASDMAPATYRSEPGCIRCPTGSIDGRQRPSPISPPRCYRPLAIVLEARKNERRTRDLISRSASNDRRRPPAIAAGRAMTVDEPSGSPPSTGPSASGSRWASSSRHASAVLHRVVAGPTMQAPHYPPLPVVPAPWMAHRCPTLERCITDAPDARDELDVAPCWRRRRRTPCATCMECPCACAARADDARAASLEAVKAHTAVPQKYRVAEEVPVDQSRSGPRHVCVAYNRGYCRRGYDCRYEHAFSGEGSRGGDDVRGRPRDSLIANQ